MIPISKFTTGKSTISHAVKKDITQTGKLRLVILNITSKCNLQCKHCYSYSNKDVRNELTYNEIEYVINQLSRLGIKMYILSGGEPFTRPDLFNIIQLLKSKKLKCFISTNGTLITNEHIKLLKEFEIDYIGISLDHVISTFHNYFRNGNIFEKVLNTMKNLVQNKLNVGIRVTILNWNFQYVEYFLRFCKKYGIKRIAFYHLVPTGRGKYLLNYKLNFLNHFRFLDHLIKLVKEFPEIEVLTVDSPSDGIYVLFKICNSEEEFWSKIPELKPYSCTAGVSMLSIYPNGNIYPCQFMNMIEIGNVRNNRIEYVLETNKVVKELNERNVCRNCPLRTYCGGCRVKAFIKSGNLFEIDPDCLIINVREFIKAGKVRLQNWCLRIIDYVIDSIQEYSIK